MAPVYIPCEDMANTQISKWGNSLAVQLPQSIAREARLDAGDSVDVSVDNGAIVIRPSQPRSMLEELVGRINARKRQDESDWGGPLGHKGW